MKEIMNVLEYEVIKWEELPEAWKKENALLELEQLLQKSWTERTIFYWDEETERNQKFIDFNRADGIKIQNYVGSLLFKGEQLNIFPKLFQKESPKERTKLEASILMKNISFWLGYCDRMNIPFFSVRDSFFGKPNFLELLIAFYAKYTKGLVERQPYIQYEKKEEKGGFIRGKLLTEEYLLKQYPTGRWEQIPYKYSEFTLDNPLNRMIKRTCQLLMVRTKEEESKKNLRAIIGKLAAVQLSADSKREWERIIIPIHQKPYQTVLTMSKFFLNSLGNTVESGKNESYCFLFPTELLFEHFVSGFLNSFLPANVSIKTQTTDQYLADLWINGQNIGKAFGLREDIVIQTERNTIILDTKYKEIQPLNTPDQKRFGISEQDIRQIAIYAAKRKAKYVFLIYPLYWKEPSTSTEITYQIQLQTEEPIQLKILKIPFLIERSEQETEQELKKQFQKIYKKYYTI